MKKIALTIIGTILTILALGFGVLAYANSGSSDWRLEREKARLTLCADIGDNTAKCYRGDSQACSKLETSEAEYNANFNAEAYLDCTTKNIPAPGTVLESGEIVEDETGIPEQVIEEASDPTNPLFYGDEQGS